MTSPKIHAAVALAISTCAGNMAIAADDSSTLDEVVVTAQFREQSLQTTPLSITAVSGDLLELRSQTNIAEVASQAPNVTLKSQGAAFGPSMGASIRGIGQFVVAVCQFLRAEVRLGTFRHPVLALPAQARERARRNLMEDI